MVSIVLFTVDFDDKVFFQVVGMFRVEDVVAKRQQSMTSECRNRSVLVLYNSLRRR